MLPVIILFAKAPVPGRVKTRLQPPLAARQACDLQTALVLDTLETLAAVATTADLELHTDIPTDAWTDARVTLRLQKDGDLGVRMHHALAQALDSGRPRAMILGADAPALPAAHVRALLDSAVDVGLGPAEDGGYWGICCRRLAPDMFSGVTWSAADTLDRTADAVRRCGLTVAFGPRWFDVDSAADLDRLLALDPVGRHTALWRIQYRNASRTEEKAGKRSGRR